MDIEIGLPGQSREDIGRMLNLFLADQHVLYIKTRNYHWNVVGPHFHSLHEFLEGQYEMLAEEIDEVAERVRQLGVQASGTMTEFVDRSRLSEEPGPAPDADTMIRNLLRDHETVIAQLRKDIDRCADEHKDQGTADLLTGIMEKHEKQAWMLRAHLEEAST
jgi:starvation-inducible DNA-binding protein